MDQVVAITKIYNQMKTEAIKLGIQLIEFEKDLEIGFQNNSVDRETLKQSLAAISQTRSDLRFVHLATHLETPKILSLEQIDKYNALRGYSNSDPCKNVPSGHNAEMWRKHSELQVGHTGE